MEREIELNATLAENTSKAASLTRVNVFEKFSSKRHRV